MTLAALKAFATGLPHAEMIRQWGDVWVFKVGGKLFLLVPFEGDLALSASFKADPDLFADLTDTEGLRPAPYLARAGWIQVEDLDAFSALQLKDWIRTSHSLVVAKLPAGKRKLLGL